MFDGDHFLPPAVEKPTNFGGTIARGCRKEFAIVAEVGICHRVRMPDSGFYLPVATLKPTNFGGAIVRGCHKVFSIEAEVDIIQKVGMLDGGSFLPFLNANVFLRLTVDKLPECGVIDETARD